jgi:hypothetical protein
VCPLGVGLGVCALPLVGRGNLPSLSFHRTNGNIFYIRQIDTSNGNLLSVEGSMIDAVLNAAVFAALVLCIVGFGAWAQKRVP